jgi:phosphoglycerate dehydrogenase-like enzyme
MTSSMTVVWLPEARLTTLMGGLPDGMTADVWEGGERLPDSAGEVEVVVLPPFGGPGGGISQLAKLPRLRLIQVLSSGAEQVIPFVPPGVALATARGGPTPSVAEWVTTVILAQARQLPAFMAAQQTGHWDSATRGESLVGKTALIVGYGSIGAAVESLLVPFGVAVERVADRPRAGVLGLDGLPAALGRADIVIMLVPTTPATLGMVDAQFLGQMRDRALLVNAARGSVVDTGALLSELRSGRLRAALDVTDPEPLPDGHPLWSAPGVLVTPHIAGATTQSLQRAVAIVRDQLGRYAAGEPLLNIVGEDGY